MEPYQTSEWRATRSRRRGRVLLGALLLFVAGGLARAELFSIGEAFRDTQEPGIPDRRGEIVELRGVITTDPVPVGRAAALVNLQDSSGGVVLFAPHRELIVGRVQRGDLVVATGEVTLYRGNRQLDLREIGRVGRAELPAPKDASAAELLAGAHPGELVRVRGTLQAPADFSNRKARVQLSDPTGRIHVLASVHLLANPAFLERFKQGGRCEIVGVTSRTSEQAGDYRLIPRDAEDVRFAWVPPYRRIGLAAAFITLLALAGVAAWHRRLADRRAKDFQTEARRATDERNRFFTLSLDMQCIAHTDGFFKRVNPAFTQTLGWGGKELLSRPFLDFLHPDDRAAARATMARLVAGEQLSDFENRFRRQDGAWRILSWRVAPQPDGTLYATARDVTDQRAAEGALRELNGELERLVRERTNEVRQALTTLDATDDGALIFDPETLRFSYVNEGAVRQLGYTREELLTMRAVDIETEYDEARFRDLIEPMLRGEARAKQITTFHRRKDARKFPVEINLQHIAPAGEQPRFISIVRDITERRKTESQLWRSQRMEALGALAGGIAHDLNNMLTPILMAIGMLKEQSGPAAPLLDTLQGSVERGADLVQQLLMFAKGAPGKRAAVVPAGLLHEVQHIAKFTFPKDIRVEVKSCDPLPPVQGDATQLHQVLLNLCVNARDAMPEGGTLTLEAQAVEVDGATAGSLPGATPGRYVVLRVSDTGAGIPAEIMDRIFDPFFTTKPPEKGTGLGLSTVAGIVKGHGGFLQVHSQVGSGSAFSVYLPAGETAPKAGVGPAAPERFRGNQEAILIIDDEPAVRSVAEALLRRMNLAPIMAADGAEGLARVAEHRGQLRAVLTDLHMPNLSGLAFVRKLRGTFPGIPVVMMSGRMEEQDAAECRELDVEARLEKPFTEAQLVEVLQALLRETGATAPTDGPSNRQSAPDDKRHLWS